MKLAFVFFFLALSCSAYGRSAGRQFRNAFEDFGKSIPESILDGPRDGRNVPIEKAPFMALVYRDYYKKGTDRHASAVIISDRYLLSSLDYFFNGDLSAGYVVYLGQSNLTSLKCKNKYIVSNLIPNTDMALIKLKKRIEFNDKQRPIALLSPSDLITGDKGTAQVDVYGFGFTKATLDDGTVVLKTKKMSIPTKQLQKDGWIYVDISKHVNSCPGDSGTPFIMGDKLVAINQFESRCGALDRLGFLMMLSVSVYHDWILHEVGEKDFFSAQQNAYRRGNSVMGEDWTDLSFM